MRTKATILAGALFITTSLPDVVEMNTIGTGPSLEQIQTHLNIKAYSEFKDRLGFLESSHRYGVTSPTGTYWGRYQFGPMALEDIGFDFSREEFLGSEVKQEQALYYYLLRNKTLLGDYYWDYLGEEIGGIEITKAGLLAAAHLIGARSVKTYIDTDGRVVPHDGNGTPLTKYLREFQTHSFEFSDDVKEYIIANYGEEKPDPPTQMNLVHSQWINYY